MASPCLVLLWNITDTSLVISPCPGKDSSFFILSTTCLKIKVIIILPKIRATGKAMAIFL